MSLRVVLPGHIDTISPLPDMAGKRVKATLPNFRAIMERSRTVIRYNVITKSVEIIMPDKAFLSDNRLNCAIAEIISLCAQFNMPSGSVDAYINRVADENPYNPAATWLLGTEWDGQSRLGEFLNTITVTDEGNKDLKDIYIVKWMMSAIYALTEPDGISAHGVLTFQGAQGLGKTYWFKQLVPYELGLTADGFMLDPDNKDSVYQCCAKWLVELGEVDSTFKKSDISQLKAFITRQTDILRRPYARTESTFPRRTVFFASVNATDFLHDDTGNRRFWVVPVKHINYRHGIDMQQVWREVYERLYLKGVSHVLNEQEMDMANKSNLSFTSVEPLAEMVGNELNWDAVKELWRWTTLTEVATEILYRIPTKREVSIVKATLEARDGVYKKTVRGKVLIFCPPRNKTG